MSPRKHRLAERRETAGLCWPSGKAIYETQEAAEALLTAIRATGRQGKGGRMEKRSYACPWCSGWHLTSKEEEA